VSSASLELLLEDIDLGLDHVLDTAPLVLPDVDVFVLHDTKCMLSKNLGTISRDSAELYINLVCLKISSSLNLQVLATSRSRPLRDQSLGHLHSADVETWCGQVGTKLLVKIIGNSHGLIGIK